MLIFSRELGEEVIIHGVVRVKVIEIHENRVRLGFEAPKEITIHRAEVQRSVEKTNQKGK